MTLKMTYSNTGFFVHSEKPSFLKKKTHTKNREKKLKTEPKNRRSLEALCSGHSQKIRLLEALYIFSDLIRDLHVFGPDPKKTQIKKKTEN